jgi:hypothetical protein
MSKFHAKFSTFIVTQGEPINFKLANLAKFLTFPIIYSKSLKFLKNCIVYKLHLLFARRLF